MMARLKQALERSREFRLSGKHVPAIAVVMVAAASPALYSFWAAQNATDQELEVVVRPRAHLDGAAVSHSAEPTQAGKTQVLAIPSQPIVRRSFASSTVTDPFNQSAMGDNTMGMMSAPNLPPLPPVQSAPASKPAGGPSAKPPQTPPAVPEPPTAPAPAVPPAPPAPPPVPEVTFPYAVIGGMRIRSNSAQASGPDADLVVWLQRGDEVRVVRVGESVDQFKLSSANATSLRFTHAPTGVHKDVPFRGFNQ